MTAATLEQFEAYSSIPTRIAHAIEGLSEQQKQHRPVEGEWNIHDVVIHLADSETVGFWRLRKTLAERDSVLGPRAIVMARGPSNPNKDSLL